MFTRGKIFCFLLSRLHFTRDGFPFPCRVDVGRGACKIPLTPVRGKTAVSPFIPHPAAIAITAAQGVRAVIVTAVTVVTVVATG